jgi:CMP-N-acetylneuraminic acid synthetase
MPEIAALVPMRHHSQRVPGKNYRPLGGKPLFHYILEALGAVPEITLIAVDTDSDVIMDGLRKDFPAVQIIERPENLRRDDIPMNEILAHDVGRINVDFYLQTHSTNPLLKPETISGAIQSFLRSRPAFDSLFSVTRRQVRFWDALTRPINHNPSILLQTQDLPPIYEENSCLYIFTRDILLSQRSRIGTRPLMFEIAPDQAWDIDDELDFDIVNFLKSRE